jgi:hypothetical protein
MSENDTKGIGCGVLSYLETSGSMLSMSSDSHLTNNKPVPTMAPTNSKETPVADYYQHMNSCNAKECQFDEADVCPVIRQRVRLDDAPIMQPSLRQVGGSHYKTMAVQPWDVVDTWPLEQQVGAYRAGALKYIMRMGSKDESVQEIGKGIHYLEKLTEVLKRIQAESK